MKYFVTVALCMVMISCYTGTIRVKTAERSAVAGGNIFRDKVLQRIYTLQDRRDAEGLRVYLTDSEPGYREAAAIAFASVQAAGAVPELAGLLDDDFEAVRSAAAYALGQVKDKSAVPFLIRAYEAEPLPAVKRDILEALGKCGTEKALAFITGLNIEDRQPLLLEGQARGLFRALLRGRVSRRGTDLAMRLLASKMPGKARFFAAHYLARAVRHNLSPYYRPLLMAFQYEKNLYTRMALVIAMGLARHPDIQEQLAAIVNSGDDVDYRLKVNAVRALGRFDYHSVKEILLRVTADQNANTAAAASEYFAANGREADAGRYFTVAQRLSHPRTRANMLGAALTYAPDRDGKRGISRRIVEAYGKAEGIYEKAYLLQALAGDGDNFRFVEAGVFANAGKEPVLGTYGMEALVTMSRAVKKDKEKLRTFARVFERAVKSSDNAMIGLAAGILRDPEMNFKEVYTDTGFLTEALNNCRLPRDIEAWQQLKKTAAFFHGSDTVDETIAAPTKNQPIDWGLVVSIPPDQRVRINTTKGDITIQLMVNEAPGSTANFVRLIREGFYKGSFFHRVVPNFVIQDGCPRGDGWGSPGFGIGSEFGPLYYEEGSVGMASAGKDTEGSQWFITHSPTPHLDGRYTIFARVVSGMDTVHKIEVGDRILKFHIM